jgi:hypothetical protein
MCEPQISQSNNHQAKMEYKHPDIEMGYKQPIISTKKTLCEPTKFNPETMDILYYKV